jgi:hypothetical protein
MVVPQQGSEIFSTQTIATIAQIHTTRQQLAAVRPCSPSACARAGWANVGAKWGPRYLIWIVRTAAKMAPDVPVTPIQVSLATLNESGTIFGVQVGAEVD